MQTALEMFLESFTTLSFFADLNLNQHFVADGAIPIVAIDITEPFAGSPRIALDSRKTCHRINISPTQFHHAVATPEKLAHPAIVAAAFAPISVLDTHK